MKIRSDCEYCIGILCLNVYVLYIQVRSFFINKHYLLSRKNVCTYNIIQHWFYHKHSASIFISLTLLILCHCCLFFSFSVFLFFCFYQSVSLVHILHTANSLYTYIVHAIHVYFIVHAICYSE